jgi:hypothetical protein
MHVPTFIAVEFLLFTKSRSATNAQSVTTFRRSREGCEWFDRHKKGNGEVSLHFQLKLNTLGFLRVPQIKN